MKIVLLPSSPRRDPTYHRILSSLKREFSALGHEAVIASAASPAGLRRLLEPGSVLNFHFSGWLRPWHAPALLSLPRDTALAVTFQDYRHPDLPPLTARSRADLRRILAKARRVTAVSRFLAGMIKKDFPEAAHKLSVIPNGADAPPQGQARRTGRDYIITVGRPAPYKGLDLLLFAFAGAVQKGCSADLAVCGAASPLRRLAARLGIVNRVHFKGRVSHARLSALMRGALFYATAPRWESFGMGALEAMAAGKAVLASRAGGIPEFARNNCNSLLVPPGDTASLAAGLLRLCGSPALRERLGKNGAASAARFSWKKAAASYLRACLGSIFSGDDPGSVYPFIAGPPGTYGKGGRERTAV